MNAVWQATEKQLILHDELVERVRCGKGALEAWCLAQPTDPKLKYPLRDGVCFLRSYSSWISVDGSTMISVPAFHAGEKEFKLIAMLQANSKEEEPQAFQVEAQVMRPFLGKLLSALREDIIQTRLSSV